MINWIRRQVVIRRLRRHHRWVKRERIVFLTPLSDPRNFSEMYKKR